MAAIWRYTATNWGVAQADGYIGEIERHLTTATRGSPLVRSFGSVLRIKAGSHFCVFRKLEGGGIEVIRILHERQDVPDEIDGL